MAFLDLDVFAIVSVIPVHDVYILLAVGTRLLFVVLRLPGIQKKKRKVKKVKTNIEK